MYLEVPGKSKKARETSVGDRRAAGEVTTMSLVDHSKDFGFDSEQQGSQLEGPEEKRITF